MSTNYDVVLNLKTLGSLDIGRVGGGRGANSMQNMLRPMQQLRQGWRDLHAGSSKFMGALDTVAHKMGNIAKWGGAALGGALVGGAMYAVGGLNKELENAKISLAGIFKANDKVADMAGGFEMAGDQVKKMRNDAKSLPGEFEDLQRIFVTAAIPAFKAGASPDELRKLSAGTMAFAAASQLNQHMAARELAILLEGRSGAHNVLGMRLMGLSGKKAEEFNKKTKQDPSYALAQIQDALAKYKDLNEAYKNSFEGLWTTAIDNVKLAGAGLTQSMFEGSKFALKAFNNFFDENETTILAWTESLNTHVSAAFDWVVVKVKEWWPPVRTFFENLYAEFQRIKTEYGPFFDGLGQSIKEGLANPETIKSLEKLVVAYAGLKVASAGISGLAGLGQMAIGMSTLWKFAGPALGAAGRGLGASALGSVGAVAGGGAAALAGGLYYAAFGGVNSQKEIDANNASRGKSYAHDYFGYADVRERQDAARMSVATSDQGQAWIRDIATGASENATEIDKANAAISKWRLEVMQNEAAHKALGIAVNEETSYLRANFQNAAADALELAYAMSSAAGSASQFAALLNDPRRSLMQKDGMTGDPSGWSANSDDSLAAHSRWYEFDFTALNAQLKAEATETKKEKTKKHPGGKGGTTIQKVEIVVTQNNSPSRVARSVVDELSKITRNPRVSPYAPSFSRY